MAPMALARQPEASWDAYTAFNVTGRFSRTMNCYGLNKCGDRCAWTIGKDSYKDLRAILDYVQTQPPKEAVKYLHDIASLSLCEDFHQSQADGFVHQWRNMLKTISYAEAIAPSPDEKPQTSTQEARDSTEKSKKLQEQVKAKLNQYKAEVDDYKKQLLTQSESHERALEVERKRHTTMLDAARQKLSAEFTSLEDKLGSQLHIARQELQAERQKVQKLAISEAEAWNKSRNLEERILTDGRRIKGLEFATVLSTTEKEMKDKKIAEQREELTSKSASIEELSTAKCNLTKEVESLKSELEVSEDTIEYLRATAKQAAWSEKSLSDQALNLQTSLNEERKLNAGLRATESDLLAKLDKLRADVAEKGDGSSELETLTKTNSELVIEKDTLQTRLDSAYLEMATRYEEHNAVLKDVSRLEKLNADLTSDNTNLKTSLSSKNKDLAERDIEVASLIQEINRSSLANSGLDAQQRTLETQLRAAESESAAQKDKSDALANKLESLVTTNSRLAAHREEADAISKEVQKLKAANSRLNEEKQTLEARLGSQGELSSLLEELHLSTEQIAAARKRPVRFMTKCWMEKARRSGKQNGADELSAHE